MLKNMPAGNYLSPDLMHALMSMGHGDELVIADGNFPAASHATNRLVRADGHGILPILESILHYLPIDPYVKDHVCVMQLVPGDETKVGTPPIWNEFERLVKKYEGDWVGLTQVERFAFYERAKKAYVVVATRYKTC
eukprot:TRINITY_DN9680_c0_g1_i2.p1 TRINITY_DN9680_c0_g1~~TRINITY_DN9680_c0_g1_i2.p1  ORF type:complete len:137 (-),score=45.14 TRINITY_DN9680_c0_g1_i2:149-559(-)